MEAELRKPGAFRPSGRLGSLIQNNAIVRSPSAIRDVIFRSVHRVSPGFKMNGYWIAIAIAAMTCVSPAPAQSPNQSTTRQQRRELADVRRRRRLPTPSTIRLTARLTTLCSLCKARCPPFPRTQRSTRHHFQI